MRLLHLFSLFLEEFRFDFGERGMHNRYPGTIPSTIVFPVERSVYLHMFAYTNLHFSTGTAVSVTDFSSS